MATFPQTGEWLADLKADSPSRYWVVIGVACWTVIVLVAPCAVFSGAFVSEMFSGQLPPLSGEEFEELVVWGAIGVTCAGAGLFVVLALPVWAVVVIADRVRRRGEAKEKTGTLICFECGHDNPVGQTNCEDCGAWVPQTAKARWAYGIGK